MSAALASADSAPHAVASLRGVGKTFGGTRALDGVDLDLRTAELHGLVGENGAGKSTLMRVLAGFFADYDGSTAIDGVEIRLTSPALARRHGIALVHQELSLVPDLTVAENIALGREPAARLPGFISRGRTNALAARILADCGLSLDPGSRVERLSIAERQLVEIAKGIAGQPRLLILDEPTSSLTSRETALLFAIVRRLRERGTAIVYISHKLEEIFALTEFVTVLRDGRKVASGPTSGWTEARLVQAMVGRDPSLMFPRRRTAPGDRRLEVRGLGRAGAFADVSFSIRAGEILGLYGIIGAGRTEVARALAGLAPADRGAIAIDGAPRRLRSPMKALAAGITFTPEDRRGTGLVPMLSVRENIVLSALPQFTRAGFVRSRAERISVRRVLTALLVRAASPEQEVAALSGGNQQKVVIGRALMPRPRVLILDEPTRGIDVIAKAEIHAAIDRLAGEGLAVLLISSELLEILGMSDRILVMREGRLAGEMTRAEASEERLVALATGVAA